MEFVNVCFKFGKVGEISGETVNDKRSKIVFISGYRPETAKSFRGLLPADCETRQCVVVKDTKPEDPRRGALIVRLLERKPYEDVPAKSVRWSGHVEIGGQKYWPKIITAEVVTLEDHEQGLNVTFRMRIGLGGTELGTAIYGTVVRLHMTVAITNGKWVAVMTQTTPLNLAGKETPEILIDAIKKYCVKNRRLITPQAVGDVASDPKYLVERHENLINSLRKPGLAMRFLTDSSYETSSMGRSAGSWEVPFSRLEDGEGQTLMEETPTAPNKAFKEMKAAAGIESPPFEERPTKTLLTASQQEIVEKWFTRRIVETLKAIANFAEMDINLNGFPSEIVDLSRFNEETRKSIDFARQAKELLAKF